jgi:hypothetical protein
MYRLDEGEVLADGMVEVRVSLGISDRICRHVFSRGPRKGQECGKELYWEYVNRTDRGRGHPPVEYGEVIDSRDGDAFTGHVCHVAKADYVQFALGERCGRHGGLTDAE